MEFHRTCRVHAVEGWTVLGPDLGSLCVLEELLKEVYLKPVTQPGLSAKHVFLFRVIV